MQGAIDNEPDADLKAAFSEMLEGCLADPERWEWHAIWSVELKNGTHVGDLSFKGLSPEGLAEIGYGVLPEHQGHGYAAEAVRAAVEWALLQPGVNAVEAETAPGNLASQKVLAKCGFTPNGQTGEEGPRFSRGAITANMKNLFYTADRQVWRAWLALHFEDETEAWLIYPMKGSGEACVAYNDAVEEALCFGWIDSTVKHTDPLHRAQRFTPRRPGSPYSQPNIERLKWLDERGLIHPKVRPALSGVIDSEFVFPRDILDALRADPAVWANYCAFPAPYQRIRVAYIDAARSRPEEFKKRLASFVKKTGENKRIVGYGGVEKYYGGNEDDPLAGFSFITLRDRPELTDAAADRFSGKWRVPKQAYLDCMGAYVRGETEYGWYLCLRRDEIVGGLGVIENDFHDRPDLTPNICAVYTEEPWRGRGVAGRLLDMAVEDLRSKGISPVYLVTDHTGFYERYGWTYFCSVHCPGEQGSSRMYVHR